jgi:glutamine synthetase
MKNLRLEAVRIMRSRPAVEVAEPAPLKSAIFGENVFTRKQMRRYLSKSVYESVVESIESGKSIDRKIADQVAEGMKVWAIERGATHYTHWFQPLNNSTAEKHDAFLDPKLEGDSFESFSGNLLSQQEPDASSFPSGGLRNTFEARGYSAWDPSSPAFITDGTLCIPGIFVSYNGEALDYKTPLLKSMAALDRTAVSVCQLFNKDVRKVVPTLGWEQEYFIVDKALADARPDLIQSGRTLMGHTAAKDQQLEDHYWGAIPERVANFMKDFEDECYKLGIPIKTRHNEVAPNQFECAPQFEEANVSVDHNLLLMSVMRKIAHRHNLEVLFHEKPFAGVNGSGKHCNWSLCTDGGVNLLAPGHTPESNIQFLTFFVCTLKAAADYGSLIMASIASESNSHRLGGNEAPPAIMSVFTGSTLNGILDNIEAKINDSTLTADAKKEIKLDIGKIPEILVDNTDRNRTSPFAFTGNRFEFRAAGSSCNCSMPLIVLNTAVADELQNFCDAVNALTKDGIKKEDAILKVIRQFITASRKIRFEGNGYSEDWIREAAQRGLRSASKATEAFKEYLRPESIALFTKFHVLNETELKARYEIKNEIFLKKVQIESRVIADIAANHIIPTAVRYQNVLIDNIKGIKEVFPDELETLAHDEIRTLREIIDHVNVIRSASEEMTQIRHRLNRNPDIIARAAGYETEVRAKMSEIREHIDALEMIVDDDLWPLPKYRELLATL